MLLLNKNASLYSFLCFQENGSLFSFLCCSRFWLTIWIFRVYVFFTLLCCSNNLILPWLLHCVFSTWWRPVTSACPSNALQQPLMPWIFVMNLTIFFFFVSDVWTCGSACFQERLLADIPENEASPTVLSGYINRLFRSDMEFHIDLQRITGFWLRPNVQSRFRPLRTGTWIGSEYTNLSWESDNLLSTCSWSEKST